MASRPGARIITLTLTNRTDVSGPGYSWRSHIRLETGEVVVQSPTPVAPPARTQAVCEGIPLAEGVKGGHGI